MYRRLLNPLKSNSFFIFGSRGVGKSTYLKHEFLPNCEHLYIDLLDPIVEDRLRLDPKHLSHQITTALNQRPSSTGSVSKDFWVVIDEVQKLPQLLDLVHHEIESRGVSFVLTGSSARKLKRGSANMLAGRAFLNELFPLTHLELGDHFDLAKVLQWGALPKVFELEPDARAEYLYTYVLTYLKEEVVAEQLVRDLNPFRTFLNAAAQSSGKIVNFSKLARDVHSDPVSVRNYFDILVDTYVGFELPAFDTSVRKRIRKNPKFYFFDLGVKRALERTVEIPVKPQTYDYGSAFEHFLILEIVRLARYHRKRWEFFYLRTKDDVEIDLIIDRPGQSLALIEIKSSHHITESMLTSFNKIAADIPNGERFCFSQDPISKTINGIECLTWQEGIKRLLF